MKKSRLKKTHKIAAIVAFILIATFQISTISVELFGTNTQISAVKSIILMLIPLLILAMITTGVTANKLYPGTMKGIFKVKQLRLKIAAINGLIILLPSAIVLAKWSAVAQFDSIYWTVQAIEIIAGMTNLTMIGLNIRDGIRLARKAPKNTSK